MKGHYSSVTPTEFMTRFVDHGQDDDLPLMWLRRGNRLKDVPQVETQLCYEALCDVFNEVMTNAELPYVMKNTSTSRQKEDDSLSAPDLCLYPTDDYARKAYRALKTGAKKRDASEAAVPDNKALTAWAWIVLFVEIKMNSDWEPFTDGADGKLKLRDTKHGAETRAQNISYAMRIQRYQHRRFVFSLSIQGTKARFLRWDRNGVVVSHEFDYIQDRRKLLKFVCYIAAATPSQQGYDDSVKRLALDEAEQLKNLVNAEYKPTCGFDPTANATLKEASMEIFADLVRHPVYKLGCSGLAPEAPRQFYIGKYRASSWSAVGRGTKVYVAYDKEAKDIAILKDYWCVVGSDAVLNEFEVLKDFLRAGIKHVPTVVAGGFVDGETTVSQEFIEQEIGFAPEIRQKLRLAVKEVGRPIDTFETSRGLVEVIYSAFKGHRGAYEMENGVLHRDISYTNIMINVATGEGFMNDWDMCKRVADLGSGPTQHSRSGTWHYMAAILQQYPRMYNILPHDLESFVYALVVPVLQFQRHNLTKPLLPNYFKSTFDDAAQTEDGLTCGGGRKTEHIRAGHPGWELSADDSPLASLIHDLYRLLQSQWTSFSKLEIRAMLAHWGTVNKKDRKHPKPEDYPIPDLLASRPMATHDSMDKIFKDALASEGWDDEGLEKTEDQFIGLFADKPALPHLIGTSGQWLTTHKRPHESNAEDVDIFKFVKGEKATTSGMPSFRIPARTNVPVMDFPLRVKSAAGNETDDVSHTDHDTDEETDSEAIANEIRLARASSGQGVGRR